MMTEFSTFRDLLLGQIKYQLSTIEHFEDIHLNLYRPRSGDGNSFTSVCHFVHLGGGGGELVVYRVCGVEAGYDVVSKGYCRGGGVCLRVSAGGCRQADLPTKWLLPPSVRILLALQCGTMAKCDTC